MAERVQLMRHLKELEHIKLDGLRFRLIDAKGMVVGRLAVEISRILQGKDKPTYNPKHNMGDVVIVTNAAHVHFTKDQWSTKLYRWHTGYPGGLRSRVAAEQWDKDPTSILRNAVHGMLPSNRLRVYRMDKLKIFPQDSHPFHMLDLVPHVPPPRNLHVPGLGWPLPQGLQPMNQDKFAFRWAASPHLRSQFQQQQQQQGQDQGAGGGGAQETLAVGRSQASSAAFGGAGGLAELESLLTEEEKAAWRAQS